MPRKLISFTKEELQEVYEVLYSHKNRFNIAFNSNVTTFLKEIEKERSDKNITFNRATSISIAITSFYHQNKITMEETVKTFLDKIEKELDNNISGAFFQTSCRVFEIIKNLQRRRFLDADVYYCNEETFKIITDIRDSYEQSIETSYQKRNMGFNKILNILNHKKVCFDYSVSYITRSQTITEKESVDYYINNEFEIWKRLTFRESEEFIKAHLTKTIDIERKRAQTNALIKKSEDTHKFLKEQLAKEDSNVAIRIISYKNAKLYPKIKISADKSATTKHLKSSVANLLWFEPQIGRRDMEIDEFIKNAENPYGNVYYQIHK